MNDKDEFLIWEYQERYLTFFRRKGNQFINHIHPDLNPQIILLGLKVDDREDGDTVYINQEDDKYRNEHFSRLRINAHRYHNGNEGIDDDELKEQLIRKLDQIDRSSSTVKFCSYPVLIEEYKVFIVVEVNKKTYDSYYTLNKDFSELFRAKISRSFIDSAVNTFLDECSISFRNPKSTTIPIKKSNEEMLNDAARDFMNSVSVAGESIGGIIYNLYDTCNIISSLRYEGTELTGTLVIAKKDHPNIRMNLNLIEPIEIKDYRKARKLLELSNDESPLISDSWKIFGLGKIKNDYNPSSESLFVINFIKHYHWKVSHNDKYLIDVAYRQPSLPKNAIDIEEISTNLNKVFTDIEKDQIDELKDIIIEASNQKHGTMLLISEAAKEESERLKNQSLMINPRKIDENLVEKITSIDGCVILDKDSTCYAFGAILDGIATKAGDSSRGARYNSAIRYYESKKNEHKVLLVIISEDGMVDFIPSEKSHY